MEAGQQSSNENAGLPPRSSSLEKLTELFRKVKKIGRDDRRTIIHCVKVGLALTLLSAFYFVNPLYNKIETSASWAVIIVVLVMDYTVGGTVGKGLTSALGTLMGGGLGLAAHYIASPTGDVSEPILLGLFLFLLGVAASFSRFRPKIKARYDLGVIMSVVTFIFVALSSYRVDKLIKLGWQRLATVGIGVGISILTSILVLPVWAGEELHKLVAANLDKLASFLEGLGAEYLENKVGTHNLDSKSFIQVYKSVLNSQPIEVALANIARWEPGHGRFSFRHPWNHYLQIGALSRQCAYSVESLTAHLIISPEKSHTLATREPEFRERIRSACAKMSSESGKALAELASSMRSMTSPSAASQHVASALAVAEDLKSAVAAYNAVAFSDVLQSATVAGLLDQIVKSTHLIAASVDELARDARFKKPAEPVEKATVEPAGNGESPMLPDDFAIDVEYLLPAISTDNLPIVLIFGSRKQKSLSCKY